MIRAAVIGAGSMGRHHARVYSEINKGRCAVELVGISDIDSSTKSLADKYDCKYYSDYIEMLNNEEIDVVSIAVPTSLHHKVAMEALGRGICVLVEKPIASTIDQGEELVMIAKMNDVHFMVGHIERFNPPIYEIKNRIINEQISGIYKIDIKRMGPFPSRIVDVGVTLDLAIHDIDIINNFIGLDIDRVYAESQQRIHKTREDEISSIIVHKSGVKSCITTSYLSPLKMRMVQVFCEQGLYVADCLLKTLSFYRNGSFENTLDNVTGGEEEAIDIDIKEPLKNEIMSFLYSIHMDYLPQVTGEEGLKSLVVAKALIESAQNKKVVTF